MPWVLWNHWFWITGSSCFLVLIFAGMTNCESLRVEVLSGQDEIPEKNYPKLETNVSDYNYMVKSHSDANRDIGGAQLGSQVLSEIDKLARVNSARVEPNLTTTKLAEQLEPTRAGKSLSQRPVTIQVKPQDISIIFHRASTLAESSDRRPEFSHEELSRIFKIYDSRNMEAISEASNIEAEVSRDLDANDTIESRREDESMKGTADARDEAAEQFPVQSGVWQVLGSNQQTGNKNEEIDPRKMKSELKKRKPEGRSLNISSTEYKYYIKGDEVINKEVVKMNDTTTNLIHKAVVINRPLFDHRIESNGSSMRKTIIKISQSNLIGIGLGALLFLLTLGVLLGLMFQKTDYLKKADSMEDTFVSIDSQTDSPSRTGQNHSLGGWPSVHENKSGSQEDLHSLDNDSFLNSLEAITTCEYWAETSWNA